MENAEAGRDPPRLQPPASTELLRCWEEFDRTKNRKFSHPDRRDADVSPDGRAQDVEVLRPQSRIVKRSAVRRRACQRLVVPEQPDRVASAVQLLPSVEQLRRCMSGRADFSRRGGGSSLGAGAGLMSRTPLWDGAFASSGENKAIGRCRRRRQDQRRRDAGRGSSASSTRAGEKVLLAHHDEIKKRYAEATERLFYLGGRMELKLRIGAGLPRSVAMVSSTVGNYEVEHCVTTALHKIHFPRPRRRRRAHLPVEFAARPMAP